MSEKEPAVQVSNGGLPSHPDPVNVVTSTDPEPVVETSNGGHVLPDGHPAKESPKAEVKAEDEKSKRSHRRKETADSSKPVETA
jgi:hypothetical protein